jgi:hypothetical protein
MDAPNAGSAGTGSIGVALPLLITVSQEDRMLLSLLVFVLTSSTPAVLQPATVAPAQVARNVRKHLLSLPYYGVFDLITFGVDQNNIVTLGGYVLTDTLKKDAEREAREAKGVVEVQNKIEIAPLLPLDDDIRHGVYHAIYGDSALSRYGTPGSQLSAMRPDFRAWGRRRLMMAPFYGYEPIGDYAIHILVKNRVVTLAGIVDNEGDKTLAGLRARSVWTVLNVDNELEVATKSPPTK